MQTFLPYVDYISCAQALDDKRLGKQRVETLQVMTALVTGRGWIHHPATKMWRGYEGSLFDYQEATCFEWLARGYSDTCYWKTADVLFDRIPRPSAALPPWLGDERLHISHQSNLIRKLPGFYGRQFPGVPDDLLYFWPIDGGTWTFTASETDPASYERVWSRQRRLTTSRRGAVA